MPTPPCSEESGVSFHIVSFCLVCFCVVYFCSLEESAPSRAFLLQRAVNFPKGAGTSWLRRNYVSLLKENYAQVHPTQCDWGKIPDTDHMSQEDFRKLLERLDSGYKPPIPTAQFARQAGAYLGCVFNRSAAARLGINPFNRSEENSSSRRSNQLPWTPTLYGFFSYVGGGKAVMEIAKQRMIPRPKMLELRGNFIANNAWKTYYWMNQTSKYNRSVVNFGGLLIHCTFADF